MSTSPDQLNSIFLCEFDNQFGRTLAFQEPTGTFSADEFDDISDYLIPKPQLCGTLVTLRSEGRVVLCWPVCLEGSQYARNALIFSLGFVLHPVGSTGGAASGGIPCGGGGGPLAHVNPDGSLGDDDDFDHHTCTRFGRVLEKMCAYLTSLEHERQLLSDISRKLEVEHLLRQIFAGLRDAGNCAAAFDAANTIHLKLQPPPPQRLPPAVEAHLAPVLVAPLDLNTVWLDSSRKLLLLDSSMQSVRYCGVPGTVLCVTCVG